MKKLRRSLSKRETYVPECSKPHQWQEDEKLVKAGTCNFPVKYLGSVEVNESRGMPICEDAVRKLRDKKKVRAVLWVSSDGLRVVDEESKGLVVDQTIEKVSFCAPDRRHERAFSYICRDGTTRRWLCHAFIAVRDSGERLSHAVGCAFAACLERKQKRDKECGVKVEFDVNKTTFARQGSFREPTMTEKLEQQKREAEERSRTDGAQLPLEHVPQHAVNLPYAVPRRHATSNMLERQGSFRGFPGLAKDSPFKRQLSLRLNELPSTLARQKDLNILPEESGSPKSPLSPTGQNYGQQVNQYPVNRPTQVSASATAAGTADISSLCQQLTEGLSELSNQDPFADFTPTSSASMTPVSPVAMFSPTRQTPTRTPMTSPIAASNVPLPVRQTNPWENSTPKQVPAQPSEPTWASPPIPAQQTKPAWTPGHRRQLSDADKWLETASETVAVVNSPGNPFSSPESPQMAPSTVVKSQSNPYNLSSQKMTPTSERPPLVKSHTIGDPFTPPQQQQQQQWPTGSTNHQHNGFQSNYMNTKPPPVVPQRTYNGGLNSSWTNNTRQIPFQPVQQRQVHQSDFDAQWNALSQPQSPQTENPFANAVKTFEINL